MEKQIDEDKLKEFHRFCDLWNKFSVLVFEKFIRKQKEGWRGWEKALQRELELEVQDYAQRQLAVGNQEVNLAILTTFLFGALERDRKEPK